MANLITPPPELVQQWVENWHSTPGLLDCRYEYIATQAAQWGADAELESCCVELEKSVLNGAFYVGGESCPSWHNFARKAISKLRATRRPKPPSLKEQALKALKALDHRVTQVAGTHADTIRRALEALPDD